MKAETVTKALTGLTYEEQFGFRIVRPASQFLAADRDFRRGLDSEADLFAGYSDDGNNDIFADDQPFVGFSRQY